MTYYLDFSEADWQRIERDWTAWWAGELERPMVVIETLDPCPDGDWNDFQDFLTRFPPDMAAEEVLDQLQARLAATRFFGDAFPKWFPNFGAGIVAAFLGGGFEYKTRTTWFHKIEAHSLADLRLDYDPDNVWWRRVQDITRAAVERWGQTVTIGHTDLGGNLDILASLRGNRQLLEDMVDAPEEVERLTGVITQLWLRYYDALYDIVQPALRGLAAWGPFWFPGKGYMLQSDIAYMISPRMFDRFVLPDLAACCDALDYGVYHLDGVGQLRHLDMLLSLQRLRAIQWIPGAGQPPPEEWLDLLERIRDAGKLCQVYVTPEGALKIVQALGGHGFVLQIQSKFQDALGPQRTLTPHEAEDCLYALQRLWS
jgi:hypothetical protein